MKKVLLVAIVGGVFITGCSKNEENKDSSVEENTSKNTSALGLQDDGTYRFIRNGHEYNFVVNSEDEDTATGATAPKKDDVDDSKYGERFTGVEKEERMYWSGRPYKDVVVGDYYYSELDFDEGYIATADVITKNGKIEYVFLDEKAPGDYYASQWGGKTKRLSGYASFQAESERTDSTLVTLVNSMQIIEDQVINENRLEGSFYSVKGASNSVKKGFVPLLNSMANTVKTPSTSTYYGVTIDLNDGLFGQLVIIKDKESDKIIEARYNEYFADTKDDIKDEDLKQFYRQSKLDSPTYWEFNSKFSENVNVLVNQIVEKQTTDIAIEDEALAENYNLLLIELEKLMK